MLNCRQLEDVLSPEGITEPQVWLHQRRNSPNDPEKASSKMTVQSKLLGTLLLVGLVVNPTAVWAQDLKPSKSVVKILSDQPGSATALTQKQKTEIKENLSRASGNRNFICTAASLTGQRESMYRVVLLRAQLVCDYAKTLNPALKITVQERTTSARKFNGRVAVVSK